MAKYGKTLETPLREFIEWRIEYYHENKRQLAAEKAAMIPSQISQYGYKAGSGFDPEQRPTEDISIRLSAEYIYQQEKFITVFESVYEKLSNQDKELIRLKYWSGELTPDGIALKLNIDKSTLYYRLNNIIVEIARRLGLVSL